MIKSRCSTIIEVSADGEEADHIKRKSSGAQAKSARPEIAPPVINLKEINENEDENESDSNL